MTTANPHLMTVFSEARNRASDAERSAYLDEACAGDAALRAEVEALLKADAEAGRFLESPGPNPDRTVTHDAAEGPGTQIGPYKLIELIGEGGMGAVYLAQQTEPVKRLVALKVIKAGMDSRQVLARFEAERQALALMDHPNIAKVLDAGTTGRPDFQSGQSGRSEIPSYDAGRPYFVMELVKGVPITKFCDERKLTPRERLELFLPVCHAIQHAHQKGIIHRDIKPSNVLVALYDGKPVPKVIDFGVAKAAGQPLTEKTLVTGLGAIVGTPEYMSPEQAELNQLDIDTRSDIYSLGILLYELLTGTTPLTRKRMKDAALLEVLRVIREEEPQKPSTRLSSTDELPSIAANRGTEPARLSRLVRGELDWVVMKALEKVRNRRYETANGFAMDVERYLAGEAVQAVPPSAVYRLRKFARRNQGPVLASCLVVLALVAGVIGTTLGLIRAEQARHGEERQRIAAENNFKEARDREAETRAVLEFVQDRVFAAARPRDQEGGLGYDVKLIDAVKAALPFVDQSFAQQPLIEASLRMTLGLSFSYLGEAQIAADQFQTVRSIRSKSLGPDHPETLRSERNLATSYARLGRFADALKLREGTLTLVKAKLGPDHPETLQSMSNLASSYRDLGRHADSVKLNEETLALRKAKLGPDHQDTLWSMNSLVNNYADLGRHADALKLCKEWLELQKVKSGPNHPYTLLAMNNLARCYLDVGRHADSVKLNEETLALRKITLGPNHPETLWSMCNTARSLVRSDRGAEAVPIIDDCLKRAIGKDLDPRLIPMVMDLRLRHFEKCKDAAGCRATAELWEQMNRSDARSLYVAAGMRAVTAAVLRTNEKSDKAGMDAADEAERAMAWLKRAVAAGYNVAAHVNQDKNLGLRDYRKLLEELEATSGKGSKTIPK